MVRSLFTVFAVAIGLAVAGCAVPDAIAYGVKAAKGGNGRTAAAPAAAQPVTPAAFEPDPPAPMAAPAPVQREAIQIEQLPPPVVR